MTDANTGLERLRNQLDAVDQLIVELIAKRTRIVEEVAAFKVAAGLDAYQPARHKDVQNTRRQWAKDVGADPLLVGGVFNLLLDQSVGDQQALITEAAQQVPEKFVMLRGSLDPMHVADI